MTRQEKTRAILRAGYDISFIQKRFVMFKTCDPSAVLLSTSSLDTLIEVAYSELSNKISSRRGLPE